MKTNAFTLTLCKGVFNQMIRNTILLIFFLLLSDGDSVAQNLVPNPSFETTTGCPNGSDIYLAVPWQGVTTNSSDYFHPCSTTGFAPPDFGSSYQMARTGVAFGGIFVINIFGTDYREYLQVKLDSVMQTDSCYLIEFFCVPVEDYKWGVNSMAACLSPGPINDVGPGLVLQHTPQIISSAIISDTANWTRVWGYYTALGGEEYITIGSFLTDSLTDTISMGGSYPGSVYFIEDVKVQKLSGCDTVAGISDLTANNLFNVYPNPTNSSIALAFETDSEKTSFSIMNYSGQIVKKSEDLKTTKGKNEFKIDLNDLSNGIYLIQVQTGSGIISKKIIKN